MAKRAGHETLGGQCRLVQIGLCQTVSAQIQLTHRAGRHAHQIGIEHVASGGIDRAAQRYRPGFGCGGKRGSIHACTGGKGRTFGRTITIDQHELRVVRQCTPRMGR